MKRVKATDEKVADEAIEEARVVAKQDSEAVAKMLALLVRDECQVGGHEGLEQRMRRGAGGGRASLGFKSISPSGRGFDAEFAGGRARGVPKHCRQCCTGDAGPGRLDAQAAGRAG